MKENINFWFPFQKMKTDTRSYDDIIKTFDEEIILQFSSFSL